MDIRAILDELEGKAGEDAADDERFQPPMTCEQRLDDLVTAESEGVFLRLVPALQLMGRHYRFLMGEATWAAKSPVNYLDALWLPNARRLAGKYPSPKSITCEKLRQHLRTRLSIVCFADEVLRYRSGTVMAQQMLPLVWKTLTETASPVEAGDLVRDVTRWLGAMSYVWANVICGRTIVIQSKDAATAVPEVKALRADLDHLLIHRTKTLPDQFRDAVHAGLRTCHLPVDAAIYYEARNPQHGACDVNLALKTTPNINFEQLDVYARWVPWPRPPNMHKSVSERKLKVLAPNEAPMWLRELWQLLTFGFFFHSSLSEAVGRLGMSSTVIGAEFEGLFFERYCVMWWDLTRLIGAQACELRDRNHRKPLPVIFHMAHNQWWVRTDTQVVVCYSVAAALSYWLSLVTEIEDGVDIYESVLKFMPSTRRQATPQAPPQEVGVADMDISAPATPTTPSGLSVLSASEMS